MDSYIVVRGNSLEGRTVKVTAENNGTIHEDTLRGAFQLDNDVPIGLYRNEIALKRRREGNEYVFELKSDWIGAEFELSWEEARRCRLVTSIEQGGPKPKRQRMEPELEELPVDGDLAASVRQYALYYVRDDNYKRCAIPLTSRLAATFRHGENKSIKKGDEIVIRSSFDEKLNVSTRAVKFIEELDTIILQSDGQDLCDKDLISNSMDHRKGMHYLLMGFSIIHEKTNHQSLSTGIIVSDKIRRSRYTGSSGSFKGDSGGSCWNVDGRLIGMQVEEVEKAPPTKDDKGRPASPASGGRCCIVPIRHIIGLIEDLLPPDSDEDWNE